MKTDYHEHLCNHHHHPFFSPPPILVIIIVQQSQPPKINGRNSGITKCTWSDYKTNEDTSELVQLKTCIFFDSV